jgi:hypothetical protein
MVEYQFIRRIEMGQNTDLVATGVHTAGLGSTGNTGHINRALALLPIPERPRDDAGRYAKPRPANHTPEMDYPMGKRERQILQLALAGNKPEMIEAVLNLMPGEAKRVWEKYGISA